MFRTKKTTTKQTRARGADGSAGFKQHSSNMSAGMGHVCFETAPLGEVVRRCLGPAIFEPGSTCWAR